MQVLCVEKTFYSTLITFCRSVEKTPSKILDMMLINMEADSLLVLRMVYGYHKVNKRFIMAQPAAKRDNHVLLVSEGVHDILHKMSKMGDTTPKLILKALFEARDINKAGFLLALLRSGYDLRNL